MTSSCPVCGGTLIEIRAKIVCEVCHTIVESCCEGGCQSTGDDHATTD